MACDMFQDYYRHRNRDRRFPANKHLSTEGAAVPPDVVLGDFDFSSLLLVTATAINGIPTMRMIRATANTMRLMILAFPPKLLTPDLSVTILNFREFGRLHDYQETATTLAERSSFTSAFPALSPPCTVPTLKYAASVLLDPLFWSGAFKSQSLDKSIIVKWYLQTKKPL